MPGGKSVLLDGGSNLDIDHTCLFSFHFETKSAHLKQCVLIWIIKCFFLAKDKEKAPKWIQIMRTNLVFSMWLYTTSSLCPHYCNQWGRMCSYTSSSHWIYIAMQGNQHGSDELCSVYMVGCPSIPHETILSVICVVPWSGQGTEEQSQVREKRHRYA